MGLVELLLLLVIAAICGSIGQSLAGYSLGGCFISMVVGFIGAVIGPWIAEKMDWPSIFAIEIMGHYYPVVWSIIGATLFSLFVGLLSRGRDSK